MTTRERPRANAKLDGIANRRPLVICLAEYIAIG
jgi:hypothetical protein